MNIRVLKNKVKYYCNVIRHDVALKNANIILISDSEIGRNEILNLGADDFITTPIYIDELEMKLKENLPREASDGQREDLIIFIADEEVSYLMQKQ
jgi:DNA-binding response OmpR family regulator